MFLNPIFPGQQAAEIIIGELLPVHLHPDFLLGHKWGIGVPKKIIWGTYPADLTATTIT